MAIMEGVTPKVGRGSRHTRRFLYDFATLGGAVGAKTLTDEDGRSGMLPDNAEIRDVRTIVTTPMTSSGSATVKVGITGNDDAFVPALAFDDGSWNAADDIEPRTAGEVPLKTTAAVSVIATIAVAALTAGKFVVEVDYTEGA